jgi:hypothetical protein
MKQGQVPRYKAGECSGCGKPRAKDGRECYCADCRAVKQAEYRARLRAKLREREELLALVERLQGSRPSETFSETT